MDTQVISIPTPTRTPTPAAAAPNGAAPNGEDKENSAEFSADDVEDILADGSKQVLSLDERIANFRANKRASILGNPKGPENSPKANQLVPKLNLPSKIEKLTPTQAPAPAPAPTSAPSSSSSRASLGGSRLGAPSRIARPAERILSKTDVGPSKIPMRGSFGMSKIGQ